MKRNHFFLFGFLLALILTIASEPVQAQTAQSKKSSTGTNTNQAVNVVKAAPTKAEMLYNSQNLSKSFTPPAYAPHMPNPYLEDYVDKKPLWIQQYPEEYKRVVEEGSKK